MSVAASSPAGLVLKEIDTFCGVIFLSRHHQVDFCLLELERRRHPLRAAALHAAPREVTDPSLALVTAELALVGPSLHLLHPLEGLHVQRAALTLGLRPAGGLPLPRDPGLRPVGRVVRDDLGGHGQDAPTFPARD